MTFTLSSVLTDAVSVVTIVWPIVLGAVAIGLGFKLGPYAKRLLSRR